jgi:hypothetical protein
VEKSWPVLGYPESCQKNPFLSMEKLKIKRATLFLQNIKGIFQLFELGGVTRLIPSAVKF